MKLTIIGGGNKLKTKMYYNYGNLMSAKNMPLKL